MHPHRNRFAFTLIPIPVGKQMQHRLRSPPGFVVEEVVLRESAHIDNAELRVYRRPSIRSRLAAIIEAGPREPSREPFARRIKLPPFFCKLRPVGVVQVIGADPIAQLVCRTRPAGRADARSLRPYGGCCRMLLM